MKEKLTIIKVGGKIVEEESTLNQIRGEKMSERTTGKKFIKIRGANVNNLKNLSVDIPRDEFVVLTGVSGSGKSISFRKCYNFLYPVLCNITTSILLLFNINGFKRAFFIVIFVYSVFASEKYSIGYA